jgi:hypothetical protein
MNTEVYDVIGKLQQLGVDGEMMQFVIDQVGMTDQILKQLIMTQPINDIRQYYDERLDYEYGNDILPE